MLCNKSTAKKKKVFKNETNMILYKSKFIFEMISKKLLIHQQGMTKNTSLSRRQDEYLSIQLLYNTVHVKIVIDHSTFQWLLAYCCGQLPGTIELSSSGLQ